jgi:hypothetical protein
MRQRHSLHRNLILASSVAFLVGASSVQCGGNGATNGFGASTGSGANGTGGTSGLGGEPGNDGSITFDVQTMDYSAEQIYASDPPPTTCDGGGMPPPVGGTPDCPSDKNLPGCDCTAEGAGATAPCWTGLRKNRDHGDCKDGTTTCGAGEQLVWGPCVGEVLPVAGSTGKAACTCFSTGHWDVANLSPCFYTDGSTSGAISTIQNGTQIACPSSFTSAPTDPWSTDTLSADCTGSFNLCYTIKAGNGMSPQPNDCIVAQVCSASYYMTANAVQTWPPLPGWISDPSASACVAQFQASGGYGQMSVDGQSDQCELIDEVFQTVTYCPTACNDPNPPAMCAMCQAGGGGSF